MSPTLESALRATWLSVWLFWLWNSRTEKRSVRSESLGKRMVVYWIPLTVGGLLLGPGSWFGPGLLRESFLPRSIVTESAGLTLCLVGAAVACWSRWLLGGNWSAVVQLKENHELVQSGPYRVVRHPIYTSVLILFVGTALMIGELRGLLAVAIVSVSLWLKLRQEERWLAEHFGDNYRVYQRRTRALFPRLL